MRSLIGSVRGKLSKKTSPNLSPSSTMSPKDDANSAPSFRGPTALDGTSAANNDSSSSSSNPFSRNAMQNPSPATRRPPPTEPPPAYSADPTTASGPTLPAQTPEYTPRASTSSMIQTSTAEDPYAFLSSFDTLFLIDDSGSMAGRSWREVREALRVITPICTAHDADGIDLYFLNHRSNDSSQPEGKAAGGYRNVADVAAVERVFSTVRPGGGTPTGTRLRHIMLPYLRALERAIEQHGDEGAERVVKPVNIIVITDGIASDDVESVVASAAKKLDRLEAAPYQVGIQFFQVGNEEGAAQALKALDDDLADAHGGAAGFRDMVDTVTWSENQLSLGRNGSGPALTADAILKTVLGSVVRKLDRRAAAGPAAAPSAGVGEGSSRRRR